MRQRKEERAFEESAENRRILDQLVRDRHESIELALRKIDGLREAPASPPEPPFAIVDGSFRPRRTTPCRGCGASDMLECYPGRYPRCGRCGAILLYLGRTPSAPCVTPNGRIDGHMAYVESKGPGKPLRCAFCKRTK